MLVRQIVQLQQINEVIDLFGDNLNGNLVGEIVLGMWLNTKMLLGDEMQINGCEMQEQLDILLEMLLKYEL
jgi:hypothetical protein